MPLNPSAFVAGPEVVERLKEQGTHISCIEEQILFVQSDVAIGLYVVLSGTVLLSLLTLNGKELESVSAPSGALLGLPVLLGGENFSLAATALAGAELSYVTREDFIAIMRDDAQLALNVLAVLATGVRSAKNALPTA